jgi:DNA-directed RNA polymerase subunit M/transcription elongation factor TFIIS
MPLFGVLSGKLNPFQYLGGLFTKSLKICPKCHAKLKVSSDGETQFCDICRYWTKVGTARLDSIMIYGWGVCMENVSFSIFCSVCQNMLKRQVLGPNIFYYCRNCGCVSSEACLSGKVNVLNIQEPLSVQGVSSGTNL